MSLESFGGKTIVLLGPTASGKTEVAAALAERIGAEIVSADAFQVYRGMNIATAKPSLDLRRRAPHHLIDILPVSESYSVARFRDLALARLPEIRERGKVPLVVGGSAMYIAALVDGLCAAPSADHGLRDSLAAEEKEKGPGWLHERLSAVDPVSAGRIHPRNLKRIIRALEVHELTGAPISQLQKEWGNRTKDDRSPSTSSGSLGRSFAPLTGTREKYYGTKGPKRRTTAPLRPIRQAQGLRQDQDRMPVYRSVSP
ncbi:MAG: tRNA (adenosine(37)-N6)-dimethylallyltransferase MiaA [Candidatus Aureabacteria bacterium]|nr:tRNA (adenosine(37)-N6)-dimethylallyltransferase MiaA [Candidatus Auribacterota bacterium]